MRNLYSQDLFDIPPSLSHKGEEALCYIDGGEDIDMAFWWHYEAGLISPHCVVTESNHASSLAPGAALSGWSEPVHQVYEG